MMFCPKCGALLKPKTENSKTILSCSCGYTNKKTEDFEIKENVKDEVKEIEVIEEEFEVHPLTDAECPKCNHDKARYFLKQMRKGDEAATKFFKCEKCNHIWRDND
jgi:DNA-directed RNA polymerase subunit M